MAAEVEYLLDCLLLSKGVLTGGSAIARMLFRRLDPIRALGKFQKDPENH